MGYQASKGELTEALTNFSFFVGEYEHVGELHFQDGPLKEQEWNGTTNEEVIEALIERIKSLDAIMLSEYNRGAIRYLQSALKYLQARTADRERRGVEGTNKP